MHKQLGVSLVEALIPLVIISGLVGAALWSPVFSKLDWSFIPSWVFNQFTFIKLGLAGAVLAGAGYLVAGNLDRVTGLGEKLLTGVVAVIAGIAATYFYFEQVEVRNVLFTATIFGTAAIVAGVIAALISEYIQFAVMCLWVAVTSIVFLALAYKISFLLFSVTF